MRDERVEQLVDEVRGVREAQWTLSPGWVAGSVRARSLLVTTHRP